MEFNCFFCNHPLDGDHSYCNQPPCKGHHVVHCYFGILEPKLFKVEFIGFYQNKEIIISYLINPNIHDTHKPNMTVTHHEAHYSPDDESTAVAYNHKEILVLPYPPITLTPSNYKEKLKTYLLFS
jgi:hypothetical protein